MSHKRIPKRRAAMAAGGVVALGAAAILLPNANASQDGGSSDDAAAAPRTLKAADASDLAARLAGLLGDSFAGSYYDSGARQLVVNVVPGDNNQVVVQAEKAGAKVREVDNSMGELRGGAQTLKAEAGIPGTAWAIDPRTNKILVTADSTVTGDRWDRLESTVDGLGSGMATVRKSAGTFKTFASGGDAIFGGGARCSLGFNVTAGDGSPAFLTAGHCGVAADQWSDAQGGQPIATVDQAVFPGEGDFALVRYDDPATEAPSEVDLGDQTLPISGAAEAAVGQEVFRMGSTTGLADGQVLGLDATVNYPEGTVTGLIQTDVCAEPGDSGGSLFTRDGLAIGLTSGGSGDCTVGGETFFQPVTTALAAVGATLGGEDGGAGAGDAGGAGAGAGEEGDAGGAGDAGDGGAGAGDKGDKGDTGDAGDAGDGAPVGGGDGSGLTG
ncbi:MULTISPECIES: S1 family peptidase [Streptomyces]|uniref:D-glycerate 2-kinase n=3 Tax=Streptomyces TaxID=1883 RepID=A0A7U9DM10_STRLI|nr:MULTISPECIES: S1 family peptidase [Streptomyces]QSJ13329.1 protease [Streptomyces lividans]WOZ02448.1 S1 family peptidase [Streptomyces violaceoruber]BDD70119.1 protease [Streptomyces coelicolor]AIJ17717.1 protease [Streptomyces lividans TK24]EFD71206.1 protease [Streptomyces lividans TK24]